jgi:hypothetical protein
MVSKEDWGKKWLTKFKTRKVVLPFIRIQSTRRSSWKLNLDVTKDYAFLNCKS